MRLYKAPLDTGGRPISTHATWFVWDGNRLLQELKTQVADDDKAAQSLSQTYVYEPESFVPLAQVRAVEDMDPPASAPTPPKRVRVGQSTAMTARHSPAELRYYHCDQIGTPRELTTADGRITWLANYKAWGNTAAVQWDVQPAAPDTAVDPAANGPQWQESNVDSSGLQPLRFQGQYFDVETGLHCNRFRYYDPACGRLVSADPIGLLGNEAVRLCA